MTIANIRDISHALSAVLHRQAAARAELAGHTYKVAQHRRLARMFERWVRDEADRIIAANAA